MLLLTGFFFPYKLMTRVVDDALHTDEAAAGDTEMSHQLLSVSRTKVGFLHHLLLLIREFKS
jgi:hypothetical protein